MLSDLGSIASIFGLIPAFRAWQKENVESEFVDFLMSLDSRRYKNLSEEIASNHHLSQSIKLLLQEDHKELLEKLESGIELSKENARLSTELENTITGGDTYPVLMFTPVPGPGFAYKTIGNYPLGNATLTILDSDKYRSKIDELMRVGENPNTIFKEAVNYALISSQVHTQLHAPKNLKMLGIDMPVIAIGETRSIQYNVVTHHTKFSGMLYVLRVDEKKYRQALTVNIPSGEKLSLPEGFPRKNDGSLTPDWDKFEN